MLHAPCFQKETLKYGHVQRDTVQLALGQCQISNVIPLITFYYLFLG